MWTNTSTILKINRLSQPNKIKQSSLTMNSKDLTNYTSYLIGLERDVEERDFDFFKFMDFENVTPLATLELSWLVSSFVSDMPGNQFNHLTNMQDSFLFIHGQINWFRKFGFNDINKYLDTVFNYLRQTRQKDMIDNQFMLTRIVKDFVLIDMHSYEWDFIDDVKESSDEYPEHVYSAIEERNI